MSANLDVFLQKVHKEPNVESKKNSRGVHPIKQSSSSSEKAKKTTSNDNKNVSRSGKGNRKDK